MRTRIRDHLRRRLPLVVVASLVVAITATVRARHAVTGGTVPGGLTEALAREGVDVVPDSILISGDGVVRSVTFLGRAGDEPSDLHHATVRVAGTTVLDVLDVTNVTRTAGAEEEQLVRIGDSAAYLVRVRGRIEAIIVVDLAGEPADATAGWSRVDRLRNAITNFQETGRFVGVGRRRYEIAEPSESGSLTASPSGFVYRNDGPSVVIDPSRVEPVEGADVVSATSDPKALPHGIAWVVDTVRNLSFVGPEPIAWLENRVYGIKDRVLRLRYSLLGAPSETDEGGNTAAARERILARIAELGDVGFPPPRVQPMLSDADANEGEWLPIVDDPFVGRYPNAAPAFAETSLRVDPARPFARAYLVAWDARQVQMRMVSGTREPESAEGRFGTGIIPRRPETLPRVVAAFNGGFQAMHGEFGMMADGTVYLPPKPFAATVGVMRDGRVLMGSWVGLPDGARTFTETAALAQIPSDMVDLRQNLTSVIEGDRFNPWERWYWGAANVNATEQTFVDRSGLCVTEAGVVIYVWGNSMAPEAMGEVMKRARCVRGMQLDMNSKHTAFEYYRVESSATPMPPVGRALRELEFERDYPEVPGLRVRGRMAIDRMEPQTFPRYVLVEPRDFFYLELRPTLPGPDLAGGVRFDVRALPQTAYPWAFARAESAGTTIVRIDPSRAVPETLDATLEVHGTRTVAILAGVEAGSSALVAMPAGVGLSYRVVTSVPEGAIVVARGEPVTARTTAALGVDREGFLVYVEATTGLESALRTAGVDAAIAVEGRLVVGSGVEAIYVDRTVATVPNGGLRFLERSMSYTGVLNPEVVPVGYSHWNRIQDTRVRYRPAPGPRRFGAPH